VRTNFDADTSGEIMKNFEMAWEAFPDDTVDFGKYLGMALHRMVLGPFPHKNITGSQNVVKFPHPHLPNITLPEWLDSNFVQYFLEGLTNDQQHVMLCVFGMMLPVADLIDLKKHSGNKTKIMMDLNEFVRDFPGALGKCSAVPQDVKANYKIWQDANVTSVGDFAKLVRTNFDADTTGEIMKNFEMAWEAFPEDTVDFGKYLGMALHRMVLGPFPDKNITVVV